MPDKYEYRFNEDSREWTCTITSGTRTWTGDGDTKRAAKISAQAAKYYEETR